MYADRSSPILALPPEIFHPIASHIPLQYFPATLSALALTSRHINRTVTQILYSKIVARNRDYAHEILDRISDDKELGLLIRELHILTDDSAFRSDKKRPKESPLITRLHDTITEKLLPHLTRFSFGLYSQWDTFNTTPKYPITYCRVPTDFWTDLKRFCPRVRGEFFRGSSREDPWMLYNLKDLSDPNEVAINLPEPESSISSHKLNADLAHSLQSLHIFLRNTICENIDSFLANTFPLLESFTVSCGSLEKTSNAMSFWNRHPGLKRLNLLTADGDGQWFSRNAEVELLPRLTHLKATFNNVRALASHLEQLQHLSVTYSLNCQVPYLLRSVIPGGLPHLKSLEISQAPSSDLSEEGTMWYEETNGEITQDARKSQSIQSMSAGYIKCIVCGAPNVEEFCLHGDPGYHAFTDYISRYMVHVERFYFRAFGRPRGKIKRIDIAGFVSRCRTIATSCKTIRLITDVSIMQSGRYLTAKIIRDSEGSVMEVVPGRGFGMELAGGEGDPFPHNPLLQDSKLRRREAS